MASATLLLIGLAALAGAIALLVYALLGARNVNPATGSLADIEKYYSQARTPVKAKVKKDADIPELPPLMVRARDLAIRLSPVGTARKLQHLLDVAGNPKGWTPERLFAFKTVGLVGLGLVGLLFGARSALGIFLFPLIGAVAGFFLPDLLVYNAGLKRQQSIQRALPDALDMLTVCVEAGLGFDAAAAQVARKTQGPVAAEFSRMLQEMQIGMSRVEALRAMVLRTTCAELRVFVSALVQAAELGVPIAMVLREQANEMRLKRRQRAEEQAQKVPVKILLPLMIFLMPALFIVILGPGVINIYHNFINSAVTK